MKKITIASAILVAASAAMTVQAHEVNEGYVTDSTDTIWRTGFGGCWRTGFWEEADTAKGCTGYKEPVAAAPAPAPKPVPKRTAPVMKEMPVMENHIVYFEYDSSRVSSVVDITNYVSHLTSLTSIKLSGHADKFGSSAYNMALSKKRVDGVADALVAKGIDRNLITTDYAGEGRPAKVCETDTKACLAENRRVEVTVNGTKLVRQ
ncbi:MAG: OmpA family protein [Pontibacterium sp.]